jgi:Zn-dependent protease
MFKSYKVFTLFGIDVKFNTSMIILLGFFYSGMDTIGFDLTKFVLLFGIVLAHEYGHALTAKRYGIKTEVITLNGLGGVAYLGDGMDKLPILKQFMITLNGPLVNVLFFVVGLLCFNLLGLEFTVEVLKENSLNGVLLYFIVVNAAMVIFNLLPIHPMDGGRLLRLTLQACKVKDYLLVSNMITLITAIVVLIFFIRNEMYTGAIIMVLAIALTLWSVKNKKEI